MKKVSVIILVSIIILGLGTTAYLQYKIRFAKSIEPSITLISPNGGETLQEGSVYTIKWSTEKILATDKIAIHIRRVPPPDLPQEGQEFDPVVLINLENTGSHDWVIAEMYPEGNYVLEVISYSSIPVINYVSDESDATFRIVKGADWQTHINDDAGYSVDYPSTWIFRDFPDTKTGTGFRPAGSLDDVSSECVTIDARGTAESEYDTPFGEYVERAAVVEIQNYEELHSIKPVMTASGLVGYETTWIYMDFRGQEKVSLPITYFENKKTIWLGNNSLKCKTVQIVLNDDSCKEVYNEMLLTFNLSH